MTTANDLRLAWLEKTRVALEAKAIWISAPAKPCQEDDELRDRAAFAFDERNAAWKAYVEAEWNAIGTCEKLQKIFALVEDYSNGQPRSSRTGAAKEMCEKILELKDSN